MSAKPQLVIPLKMDMAEALKQISDLTEKVEKLAAANKKGMQDADKETKTFSQTLGDLAVHQGYQIAKDLAQSMMASFKEAYQYVKGMSEEFVRTQQTMAQIAALMGRDNSDQFSKDQANLAVQANLKVDEWVRFQEQFQSYGGAYLEGDQQKIKPDEAIKYQQYVAEFAKARGVDPMQAAQLAGGILQFAPGEITAQEGIAQFGKIFKTLERAPTPVNQLLPQLTRIMAQGASGTEAAQLLTLASEFSPGEEGTAVENTLKAIRGALLDGKGGELGVKEGMTPLEQVKAATATIDARVKAGETQNAVVSEYFKDVREFRGAQGFLNRGTRAGGYGRVQGYIDDTADNFVETALDAWEKSDAGRRAGLIAEEAWAKTIRGADYANLAEQRQKAKNELIREGRFEETTPGDVLRGVLGYAGFGSRDEQLTDQRMYQNVLKDAGQGDHVGESVKGFAPSAALQDETVKWLRHIAETNERMANQDPGPRPLSAPAPRVQRAPGG